jgi:hypothetical protein
MGHKGMLRSYTRSKIVQDVIGLHKQIGLLNKELKQRDKEFGHLTIKLKECNEQKRLDSNFKKYVRKKNPELYAETVKEITKK